MYIHMNSSAKILGQPDRVAGVKMYKVPELSWILFTSVINFYEFFSVVRNVQKEWSKEFVLQTGKTVAKLSEEQCNFICLHFGQNGKQRSWRQIWEGIHQAAQTHQQFGHHTAICR